MMQTCPLLRAEAIVMSHCDLQSGNESQKGGNTKRDQLADHQLKTDFYFGFFAVWRIVIYVSLGLYNASKDPGQSSLSESRYSG
jgi:hypothetical protein